MAFVRAIVLAFVHRGIPFHAVLEQAHIAPTSITDDSLGITAWQMERLSSAAMHTLDDEALGWFSHPLPWGSYGMLARASISAPTLGVAMRRWCRHHGLLTNDISLSLSVDGDTAWLRLTEQRDLGALREFCLVSVLRNFHGLACWLIDSRIQLQSAQFAHAPPAHSAVYPLMFGPAVSFQSSPSALSFDARYLALPLRRDESALQRMLQNPLPLTVLQYRRDRLLVQRVRQALQTHGSSTRNAQTLANHLAMSVRTLHRQLREENASLQALRDEVRCTSACDALLRTQRPIKQIAMLAGFNNEKSFSRAFKSWQGCTPGAFRRLSSPQSSPSKEGN
jgi:AraC-like DNA-binding protein